DLDAGPQSVQIIGGKALRATGRPSRKYHLQFIRQIEMTPTGTAVNITNSMVTDNGKAECWSIWEVTQVNDPDRIKLRASREFPNRYRPWPDGIPEAGTVSASGRMVTFRRSMTKGGKIGGTNLTVPITAFVSGGRFSVWADEPGDKSDKLPD